MNERTRSDRIFEEVSTFLKDPEAKSFNMVLYSSEIRKLEKYFTEKSVQVNIFQALRLSSNMIKCTLTKM